MEVIFFSAKEQHKVGKVEPIVPRLKWSWSFILPCEQKVKALQKKSSQYWPHYECKHSFKKLSPKKGDVNEGWRSTCMAGSVSQEQPDRLNPFPYTGSILSSPWVVRPVQPAFPLKHSFWPSFLSSLGANMLPPVLYFKDFLRFKTPF